MGKSLKLSSRVAYVLLLVGFASIRVQAQEDAGLDDLFDDPVEDVVLVDTQTDHLTQYVTSDKIRFFGKFESEGGVAAGWTAWPNPSELGLGFDGSIGLTATASLYFDARPDPDFRMSGYVTTTMNPLSGAYTWNGFSIGELFIDYTWMGSVLVRMGQHAITWGQGRLFEEITNIMSDASGSFSVRASMPTLFEGVSVIGLINSADISSYQEVCYAVKIDEILWSTMLSAAARYQRDEGLNALVSAKRTIFGLDVFADVILHYLAGISYRQVLVGFYKEWNDILLYGEYYYNGATLAGDPAQPGSDHTVGLTCGFNNIFGTTVDLGFQWIHTFFDQSGSIIPGITWRPWKLIKATLALPVAYGPDESRYVTTLNEDVSHRRIALALKLEFTASF